MYASSGCNVTVDTCCKGPVKAHVVRTQINNTGSHAPAVGSKSQNQAISLNIKKKNMAKKIKNTKTMRLLVSVLNGVEF